MFNAKLFVLLTVALCLVQSCTIDEPEPEPEAPCKCGKPDGSSCGAVKSSGCGCKPCRCGCPCRSCSNVD
ncbi:uncharacterized protein Dana_GF16412 [Drosophila ananassae]|uniref:Uncharacterized protein n=1 Tax=Drosophila ananassae TaxID=7217 RepID=B3LVP3_DROAN|nr:uncharacterized protein LOC6499208 [Drosophila ananassae]EDV43667.1 uncharacterized protein Dana_GF16412 [Drosophila ananassae]